MPRSCFGFNGSPAGARILSIARKSFALTPVPAALTVAFGLLSPTSAQTYSLTKLGILPGGTFSCGNAVNDNGQVTGCNITSVGTDPNAFLFSDGALTGLNTLIAPGSGFQRDKS